MKALKYRRAEHSMHAVYGRGLGMRAPYAMLVDGPFCRAAFRHSFDPAGRMETVLGGTVRPLVTGCVLAGLRADADAARAAASQGSPPDRLAVGTPAMARNIELRRCGHRPVLPGAECIRQTLIAGLAEGDDGAPRMRYVVATDDAELKRWVRSVPGTPLVYVERTFPLLEAPTRATLEMVAARATARQKLQPHESAVIKQRILGEGAPAAEPLHRKKRAKAPNPLSVKRPVERHASLPAEHKRKRKRRGGAKQASAPLSA